MNEKGFFTVIGICFLLVAAILVKGVQESEKNYSLVTQDFQTGVELQNIADSALIEAVELIKKNREDIANGLEVDELVPKPPAVYNLSHQDKQHKINLNGNYDADVEVYAEYGIDTLNNGIGNIWFMKRTYSSSSYNDDFVKVGNDNLRKKGIILISVASREIDNVKVYRRTMGYFFTDEDTDGKIYFMNSL